MFGEVIVILVAVGSYAVFRRRTRPARTGLPDAHQREERGALHVAVIVLAMLLITAVLIAALFFLNGVSHYHGWNGNGGTNEWLLVFCAPIVYFALAGWRASRGALKKAVGSLLIGTAICLGMALSMVLVQPWCYELCTRQEQAAILAYHRTALLLLGAGIGGLLSPGLLTLRSLRGHFSS